MISKTIDNEVKMKPNFHRVNELLRYQIIIKVMINHTLEKVAFTKAIVPTLKWLMQTKKQTVNSLRWQSIYLIYDSCLYWLSQFRNAYKKLIKQKISFLVHLIFYFMYKYDNRSKITDVN